MQQDTPRPTGPIEFRYYLRAFTLEDLARGLQPVRMEHGTLFAPPQLQYRYRSRVQNGEATRSEWSEWRDVPYVREGFGAFDLGDVPITGETVRQ